MFKHASFFMGGESTQAAIRTNPQTEEMLVRGLCCVNSALAISKFKAGYPEAYQLARDSQYPVAVSFIEDLMGRSTTEEGKAVMDAFQMVGVAEAHIEGGYQLSITIRENLPPHLVHNLVTHELRHIEDFTTGRLVMDHATNSIIFDGVTYNPIRLPTANPADVRSCAEYCVQMARYCAQPWEFRANDGLWEQEFPSVKELVEKFGTTWHQEWDDLPIVDYMVENRKNLYRAVEALLPAR